MSASTVSVSWEHRTWQGLRVKNILTGVRSWRDETSPHDAYTLRVMYSPEGRKLASAMVEDDGSVAGWTVIPTVAPQGNPSIPELRAW